MRLVELEKVIQASHIRGMGRRKIKYSLLIEGLKRKESLIDIGVIHNIILKCILKECFGKQTWRRDF